jgi:hypothetical protein
MKDAGIESKAVEKQVSFFKDRGVKGCQYMNIDVIFVGKNLRNWS